MTDEFFLFFRALCLFLCSGAQEIISNFILLSDMIVVDRSVGICGGNLFYSFSLFLNFEESERERREREDRAISQLQGGYSLQVYKDLF